MRQHNDEDLMCGECGCYLSNDKVERIGNAGVAEERARIVAALRDRAKNAKSVNAYEALFTAASDLANGDL